MGTGLATTEKSKEAGQQPGGRSACRSEAGCRWQGFSGGGGEGGRRGGTGWRWKEGGSTRPGMELQSGGSERGRP